MGVGLVVWKGKGRKEKGERRKEKGERRKEKGERRKEEGGRGKEEHTLHFVIKNMLRGAKGPPLAALKDRL